MEGSQRKAEPTESWTAFRFSCFSICPQGGTLLLYLLNMYVSYWSWRSHYISMKRGWVTMGAPSSFSFIWACLLPDASLSTTCSDCLIYHVNQIWKCRSQDRAQTHCYECNLEASWGRPPSKFGWKKCREWVSGENRMSQQEEKSCTSLNFQKNFHQ